MPILHNYAARQAYAHACRALFCPTFGGAMGCDWYIRIGAELTGSVYWPSVYTCSQGNPSCRLHLSCYSTFPSYNKIKEVHNHFLSTWWDITFYLANILVWYLPFWLQWLHHDHSLYWVTSWLVSRAAVITAGLWVVWTGISAMVAKSRTLTWGEDGTTQYNNNK